MNVSFLLNSKLSPDSYNSHLFSDVSSIHTCLNVRGINTDGQLMKYKNTNVFQQQSLTKVNAPIFDWDPKNALTQVQWYLT